MKKIMKKIQSTINHNTCLNQGCVSIIPAPSISDKYNEQRVSDIKDNMMSLNISNISM